MLLLLPILIFNSHFLPTPVMLCWTLPAATNSSRPVVIPDMSVVLSMVDWTRIPSTTGLVRISTASNSDDDDLLDPIQQSKENSACKSPPPPTPKSMYSGEESWRREALNQLGSRIFAPPRLASRLTFNRVVQKPEGGSKSTRKR